MIIKMNKIISIFFLIAFLGGCMGSGTKLTEQQKSDYDKAKVNYVFNNCLALDTSLNRHVIEQKCSHSGYNPEFVGLSACKKADSKYARTQIGSWFSFTNEVRRICLYAGESVTNAHSYFGTKYVVNEADINKQNKKTFKQTSVQDIVAKSKDTCKNLGFIEGTQEMANCSLEIYKTESQIASNEEMQNSEDSLNSSLLLLQMGSGLLNANKPKLRCRKSLSNTVSCY